MFFLISEDASEKEKSSLLDAHAAGKNFQREQNSLRGRLNSKPCDQRVDKYQR